MTDSAAATGIVGKCKHRDLCPNTVYNSRTVTEPLHVWEQLYGGLAGKALPLPTRRNEGEAGCLHRYSSSLHMLLDVPGLNTTDERMQRAIVRSKKIHFIKLPDVRFYSACYGCNVPVDEGRLPRRVISHLWACMRVFGGKCAQVSATRSYEPLLTLPELDVATKLSLKCEARRLGPTCRRSMFCQA